MPVSDACSGCLMVLIRWEAAQMGPKRTGGKIRGQGDVTSCVAAWAPRQRAAACERQRGPDLRSSLGATHSISGAHRAGNVRRKRSFAGQVSFARVFHQSGKIPRRGAVARMHGRTAPSDR